MIYADLLVQGVAHERAVVDRCNEAIRESILLIDHSKMLRDKCAATKSRACDTVSTMQVAAGLLCRWPQELAG